MKSGQGLLLIGIATALWFLKDRIIPAEGGIVLPIEDGGDGSTDPRYPSQPPTAPEPGPDMPYPMFSIGGKVAFVANPAITGTITAIQAEGIAPNQVWRYTVRAVKPSGEEFMAYPQEHEIYPA